MAVDTLVPIPIEVFGSLCTTPPASNLPVGLSPDNQDIEYTPGGWRTRPGLGAMVYAALGGGITGLKSFVDQVLSQNLLVASADGKLSQDITMVGVLTTLVNTLTLNSYMTSTTLFDQEWMGFSDRKVGIDAPRHWDNTPITGGGVFNVDRVSQHGPGAAPSAADGAAGSIPIGIHAVAVAFILRSGYITPLSPQGSWNAAGALKVNLTNIPIGPPNVVARLIAFSNVLTAAPLTVTGPLFSTAAMFIDDNVATTLTCDFTAAQLSAGLDVSYLVTQRVLPYAAGARGYQNRTFWWGVENALPFWNNLDFAGGWSGARPLGWTNGAASAGETKGALAGPFPDNDCYEITGDGATATRGQITQSAFTDPYTGAKLIQANTAYLVRAKIKKDAGLAAGRINIHLQSTASAINTTGIQVTAANLTTSWVDYSGTLTAKITGPIPSDLLLEIFADQTPTNLQKIYVTEIRILPSLQPYALSDMFVSGADDPEAFDAASGLISAGAGDGQATRNGFELRDFFYIVKERGLYVTQNDPNNEPADWSVDVVDERVGTSSPHGVGIGEGFAVICGRNGAYLFTGGMPKRLTKEIDDLWDSINWQYGHLMTCTIHMHKRQVRISAPVGAGITACNKILVLDFAQGWEDPYVEGGYGLELQGGARKWTIWNIAASAMGLIEQTDGDDLDYMGTLGGLRSGRIYKVTDGVYNDDGDAINGYNVTAYAAPRKLGSGRKLFGYLSSDVEGNGTMIVSLLLDGGVQKVIAPYGTTGFTITSPMTRDFGVTIDASTERMAIKVGTNAAGEWVEMSSTTLYAKKSPYAPTWGTAVS